MPVKSRSRRVRRKPQQSESRTRTYIIIGAIAAGIIGLGFLLYLSLNPQQIRGVVEYPRPSRGHDDSIEIAFGELPPAGGTHNSTWQNCGIYTEPILPQHAIHSLEHGTVWITYQPDLAQDEVTELQELVRQKMRQYSPTQPQEERLARSYLLLSPYPEQRSPIVLTAWGVQLEVESARDGRIEQFIDFYRLGPQTPERNAACVQGVGEPMG